MGRVINKHKNNIMKKHETLTGDVLKNFGFKEDGEYWHHPYLDPKGLLIVHFDLGYHFVLRQHKYQGIGLMNTIKEFETGFNFVTGKDLFTLLAEQKI